MEEEEGEEEEMEEEFDLGSHLGPNQEMSVAWYKHRADSIA